jgi:methionyl-tRNA synthetase
MAKDMSFDSFKADPEIKEKIEETKNNSEKSLSEFKFNESLSQIWELISFCDRLIEKERPWEDSENKKQIIFNLLFLIKNIASLIFPFLPSTSEKIKEIIGDNGNNSFKAEKREPLFPRI